MAFAQELCRRRVACDGAAANLRDRFLSGPARPHRRQRRHDTGIGIEPAQRIGVPAFRAARVEQKIVKVPEHEIVVALGQSQAAVASSVDLEKDLAIDQQSEKLEPGKTVLPAQPPDLLRRRQHGEGGRDLRIADLE